MENEKRMVGDYTVLCAVNIGSREIILAENEQDKYVTISINKKSVEDARTYFARVGADLIAHFARLGSKCVELEADERLRIVHDFFRVGEETAYHFNIKETRKKGHDFKDYVCPDTMEFEKDYDLWRVENGKIAEHWDVMETIADKSTWQNQNGKF